MRRLLVVCAILSASAAVADPATLAGTWCWTGKEDGVSLESITTYAVDGTYRAEIRAKWLAFRKTYRCSGTWSMDGSTLVARVDKSDEEKHVPVSTVYRMEDLAIEGDRMTYRLDGKEEAEARVKEE